ncbi:MAG: hypothetical protein HY328_12115 [Chloroflexi bacterium]|nr:hypothetical protein [Chloroflexota bacterium]
MSKTDDGSAATIAGSSLIDVRMWFDESPWRIAAGWTVLAALLASGTSIDYALAHAPTLLLIFLLADPLWGSIWGLMSNPESLPSLQRSLARRRVWLPYLRSGSPAARLFGMDGPSILAIIYRVALPAIFLALAVSFILHPAALWLTAAVIVISTAGWLHRQVESVPVQALYVLVTVFLPWLLVVLVLDDGTNQTSQLLLAGLWSLHVWGAQTHQSKEQKVLGLAAIAATHVGMGVLLILAQLPLWLVFVAILSLPTWLAVYQGQSLERVRFWWMAAMLTSGLALGSLV